MFTNTPPTANASSLSRRDFLSHSAGGMMGVALAWLLQQETIAAGTRQTHTLGPHFTPRVKRVINIFSPGGVSHVDTFDHKPKLAELDGQPVTGIGKVETFFGTPGKLMKSPYEFRQHGQSGRWVSSLLPHMAECVDDITFIHSMTTNSSSHTPACFQMNTGFVQNGFPSIGAWLSYGLGSENDQLPTFVVLPDARGVVNGGSNNWSQGFLPAEHQGTAFSTAGASPVAHLNPPTGLSSETRAASSRLLAKMNQQFADDNPGVSALAARLKTYELAARMQASIPRVVDFADETAETLALYGIDDERTAPFGRNCLLARRLVERGVRFVQLYNGGALGSPRINWDAHEDLKQNHDAEGLLLDKPCAGLLKDLKRRGLLEDTLLVWSTEFGRTPMSEAKDTAKGRDHHPHAFTCWMAGAGLKPGISHGATDELGYHVTENKVTIYDFHATILHLLGLDHTRLTFYHNGIERRLTDVHGEIIKPILA